MKKKAGIAIVCTVCCLIAVWVCAQLVLAAQALRLKSFRAPPAPQDSSKEPGTSSADGSDSSQAQSQGGESSPDVQQGSSLPSGNPSGDNAVTGMPAGIPVAWVLLSVSGLALIAVMAGKRGMQTKRGL